MHDTSSPSLRVLGIWIGSPARLPPLHREGIFRFVVALVQHLAEHDPALRFEIWCCRINLARVRELFQPVLDVSDIGARLVFRTEFSGRQSRAARARSWVSHGMRVAVFGIKATVLRHRWTMLGSLGLLTVTGMVALLGGPLSSPTRVVLAVVLVVVGVLRPVREAGESLVGAIWDAVKRFSHVLPAVARGQSDADCFLVQNTDLEDGASLGRPTVVNLHDLYTLEFASLFGDSRRARRRRAQGQRAVRAAEVLARQGAVFVSNSDHIRRTHALGYIKTLRPESTEVVPLPAPIFRNVVRHLPDRGATVSARGITPPYLFYPTHLRPYKNVMTLLKALVALRTAGRPVTLVLTGDLADDPACQSFVDAHRLHRCVVSTGDLSEAQMVAVYRDADLVVVPTLSEGGFPWQALEAMTMDVPVVLSRIPVVVERLARHGYSTETCALRLFEPTDDHALARAIGEVLDDPHAVRHEQAAVRRALLAWNWRDVARAYHVILNTATRRRRHDEG